MKKMLIAFVLLILFYGFYSYYDQFYGVNVSKFEQMLVEDSAKELVNAISKYKKKLKSMPSDIRSLHPEYISNSFQILPSRLRGRIGMQTSIIDSDFIAIDTIGVWRIVNRNGGGYFLIGDWRLLGMNYVPVCEVDDDKMNLSFVKLREIVKLVGK